jgi:hypothetical protein
MSDKTDNEKQVIEMQVAQTEGFISINAEQPKSKMVAKDYQPPKPKPK